MPASGQRRIAGVAHQEWILENGDSVASVQVLAIPVFARKADLRRYWKLVQAVKKVYPIACSARIEMRQMEEELLRLPTRKEQRAYIKSVERRIKQQYEPVFRRMSRTQGRVLIKLVDRETDHTAYEIVRQFRGGFVAGFWQGIARIFGHNLKNGYDAEGDDRILEQIILNYEAGLL